MRRWSVAGWISRRCARPPRRRRARPAGARVVYLGRYADHDFVRDHGVLWINPMWPWADTCVAIEGYDVPLLAASAILNGAIA